MTALILSQNEVHALLTADQKFPVDFDAAWQWAGYSTKGNALRYLKSNFEEGFEFLSIVIKTPQGGRPIGSYSLSNDCFKMLCMMAGTEKGKEVRRYYLACERQLKQAKTNPVTAPEPKMFVGAEQAIAILKMLEPGTPEHAVALQTFADIMGTKIPPEARIKCKVAPKAKPIVDSVQDFLQSDRIALNAGPEYFTPSSELYAAYREYCLATDGAYPENELCANATAFGCRLKSLNGQVSTRRRTAGKQVRGFSGLALLY